MEKNFTEMIVENVGSITSTALKAIDVPVTTTSGKQVVLPSEVNVYYVPFMVHDAYDRIECIVKSSKWSEVSKIHEVLQSREGSQLQSISGELMGNDIEGRILMVKEIITERYLFV